jgi:AcrR family transcriptional regulator
METIAERAGVAVGTLYNHFKDRAAMLDALMEGRREALIERLDAVLESVDGRPFREQLQAYVAETFAHFGEHARFFHIVMQSEGLTASRKPRSPTLVALSRRLQTLIARGVASGEVRGEDEELLPVLLMGMVRAALLKSLESEKGGGLERWGSSLTEVFLHGVEVR